jgi:hypothetical protein
VRVGVGDHAAPHVRFRPRTGYRIASGS